MCTYNSYYTFRFFIFEINEEFKKQNNGIKINKKNNMIVTLIDLEMVFHNFLVLHVIY